LSLSYCIPPDHPQPIYIPIVFNNSRPDQLSYFIRSLETGHTETKTISGSSLKKSNSHISTRNAALRITNDEDEEDVDGPEVDPEMVLVLKGGENQVDVSRLPSVKPSDSLALVPKGLESSQEVLFIKVDKPSVVSLKSVLDRRGDRFQIAPHKQAVIVECPTGGHFTGHVEEKKVVPAELRCVGDEEVINFQARGVGALRVGWRKKSRDSSTTGTIEGIEEDIEPVDELALVRRDRVSKTHTVPFRIQHDMPGLYTYSLTSVLDSMHNTYTPTGNGAKKVYNVIPRSSVRFECTSPKELLVGKTTRLQMSLEGVENVGSAGPIKVSYTHKGLDGKVEEKVVEVSKKSETITVGEAGIYTLTAINGACEGSIMEPASCVVQLVPLPTVDVGVTTLHEWCVIPPGLSLRTAQWMWESLLLLISQELHHSQSNTLSSETVRKPRLWLRNLRNSMEISLFNQNTKGNIPMSVLSIPI
jgi:nucleoporin POM152